MKLPRPIIDIDELRKEIAVKYDMWVPKNDPVLATVIFNEEVFSVYIDMVNTQNEAYRKEIINALQQGQVEAKAVSTRAIAETSKQVSKECSESVKETMDEGRENIRKDLEYAWETVEKSRKAAMFWAVVAGLFAVFTAGKFFIA